MEYRWEPYYKPNLEEQRRHEDRMERARLILREPPKPRSHAERMDAARGIWITSGDLAISATDRRRLLQHRKES